MRVRTKCAVQRVRRHAKWTRDLGQVVQREHLDRRAVEPFTRRWPVVVVLVYVRLTTHTHLPHLTRLQHVAVRPMEQRKVELHRQIDVAKVEAVWASSCGASVERLLASVLRSEVNNSE